jgi:hypothetical protein
VTTKSGRLILSAKAREGRQPSYCRHIEALALEHVPEKLHDFSDQNMLQFIDFERFLSDRKTLWFHRLADAANRRSIPTDLRKPAKIAGVSLGPALIAPHTRFARTLERDEEKWIPVFRPIPL